jgi:hypothetical protein
MVVNVINLDNIIVNSVECSAALLVVVGGAYPPSLVTSHHLGAKRVPVKVDQRSATA